MANSIAIHGGLRILLAMKTLAIFAPAALLLSGCVANDMWSEAPGTYRHADSAPVSWWGRDAASIDMFYSPLSGYGSWMDYPSYGRVFVPTGMGAGWKPYSRGYWANDRYGRRWMSSEPFGWATYHYGRWANDPRMGWFWVPDTRFSAAWVDWRQNDGYASWAPMAPIGWNRFGSVGNDWWMSAPNQHLWRPGLNQHIRPGRPDWNRPGQPNRPGRPDRPDWQARPDRPDWQGRPDRPEGQVRPGRPGRPEGLERPPVAERPGGVRPSRPDGVRPGRPEGVRPSRPEGMRPPRPQMSAPRPERATPPRVSQPPRQGREAAPRTQEQ